jgi:hypothetical protein
MKVFKRLLFVLLLLSTLQFSCKRETSIPGYKTKNVVVVIMDGARYSETWGDPSHANIPHMANQLAREGTVYTNFYNEGPTYTLAGHAAITTGYYQEIDNTGLAYPSHPSFFQLWGNTYESNRSSSYIITSKDKLAVLGNCSDTTWKNIHVPLTDCGINGGGVGSGYRSDSLTYLRAVALLSNKHPRMALINFMEPDNSAHTGVWSNYLKGIRSTDEYAYKLWEFIQTDSFYNGKTTFILTNDHGRHLDNVLDGFANHGDSCEGCRHIFLYACGPDFKHNMIINTKRELIDIPATIAELLQFSIPGCRGKVMNELLETKK